MNSASIPVIDYRRRRMTLQWHTTSGSWTAYDEPPAIVHGVCFIRASGPNICLYAETGVLNLQIDARIFRLAQQGPRIISRRSFASFGLRSQFRVDAAGAEVLYRTSYWTPKKDDFFQWLASMARRPEWREQAALRWTEGLNPQELRAEVNPPAPP